MKHYKVSFVCILIAFFVYEEAHSQSDSLFLNWLKEDIAISGQWFLGYQYLNQSAESISQFTLKRGYLTFKKNFNDRLSVRFTQDITLDKEGSDAGNVEMRLKYCYLKINPQINFLKDAYFELGLIHRPWLDYEQKINTYRVQGKMFLERYDLMSSADFGVTFISNLGGTLPSAGNQIYTANQGRFGSFSLGIYNGAGYHAIEKNKNKTIEGRLSLRPLYKLMPGLLLNYSFVYGKGNLPEEPDFEVNTFFGSFENKHFILTAQYYFGRGDSEGFMVDENTLSAFSNSGYSFFGELFLLPRKISLFGRYDNFISQQAVDVEYNTYIGGISFHFLDGSKFVFDVDYSETNGVGQQIYEAAIEIRF